MQVSNLRPSHEILTLITALGTGIGKAGGSTGNDDFNVRRSQMRMITCGLFQQVTVIILLHGFQDQRWIGGRVLRRIGVHCLEVAGVGDDGGELLELFELVHRKSGL